jgi:DNA-directed RNA polymerase specialized sigma24 family protein
MKAPRKENHVEAITSPFPATRWTWLDEASKVDETRRLAALEAWLRLYYPAMKAYVSGQFRFSAADTEDCLQDFVVDKVIGRGLLEKADRERGRFRTFLCQALNHFVIDRHRRERALKRAPSNKAVPLESVSEDELHHQSMRGAEQFNDLFFYDAIQETLRRMKQRCMETNRGVLWQLFVSRVLDQAFDDRQPVPYARLVPLLSLDTAPQAANLVITAKRMFARTLRSVLREYAVTNEELNGELKALEHFLERAPVRGG